MFTQCSARITQAYDQHTETWCGFEIRFTEYVKEISLTNMPSHRRRDRKSKNTPLELSQRRAVNGQLLWLGMQCLPQLLSPLLMAQTPQATMDTIYGVSDCMGQNARKLKLVSHILARESSETCGKIVTGSGN